MRDFENVDIDRHTGMTITGWPVVIQSIEELFRTSFGQRIMCEWYGSLIPDYLGQPVNEDTLLSLTASAAAAISVYEPRFELSNIDVVSATRTGRVTFRITGNYRPRALRGDMESVGQREATIGYE